MSTLWLSLRTRVSVLNAMLSERRRTLRFCSYQLLQDTRCQLRGGSGCTFTLRNTFSVHIRLTTGNCYLLGQSQIISYFIWSRPKAIESCEKTQQNKTKSHHLTGADRRARLWPKPCLARRGPLPPCHASAWALAWCVPLQLTSTHYRLHRLTSSS